ncbi:MAG: hypothetical protein M3419_02470 [Actinomycetota bacterium]|nr:hypothetical protein [Actinomycetota bacterium]
MTAATLALVVTQTEAAQVLAAGLRLVRGEKLPPGTVVFSTGSGSVAAVHALPGGADSLARSVSTVLRGVPVVLITREEDRLTAVRWRGGAAGESLAPGLLLSTLDDRIEDLLIGGVGLASVPDVIEVAALGRWRAAKLLAAARRAPRR